MGSGEARLRFSVSTWQQPLPRPASPERGALIERVAERVLGLGEGRLRVGIEPLTQIDHSAVRVLAAPDAVLIVEGVFAFRPEINGHWDCRIWVAVDPETSVRRGIERDRDTPGSDFGAMHRNLVIDNSAFDRPRIIRGPN